MDLVFIQLNAMLQGGLPEINLASTCNNVDNATFQGSALADCSALATDINYCQAKGKTLTIRCAPELNFRIITTH